jgi:hypothetical protein
MLGCIAIAAAAPSCTDLVDLSPFPCAIDGTCPIDLSCSAGQCVKFCSTTTDCPDGRICSAGACLESCEEDGDCREGQLCGGGVCLPDATGAVCGNATCEAGETCDNCVADCPVCAVCGNFACEGGETCDNCQSDCACAMCGDAFCDSALFEDCANCPNDCCPASCGDSTCGAGEDCINCPNDCVCPQECTLFAAQCPGDQTCIIIGSATNGGTTCSLVGGKQLGEACFLEECGYDAVCWGVDPNFFCTAECDFGHACSSGAPCIAVTNLPNGGGVCQF